MAAPTTAELGQRTALLEQAVDVLREQVETLELVQLRERVKVLEERLVEVVKAVDGLKPTKAEAEEMGALKNRLTQLEEQKKLGDTRVFQFVMLFVGGVVTLAINIALLFLKK